MTPGWQTLSTMRSNYAAGFVVGVRFIGPKKGLINQAPTPAHLKVTRTPEPATYLWRSVLSYCEKVHIPKSDSSASDLRPRGPKDQPRARIIAMCLLAVLWLQGFASLSISHAQISLDGSLGPQGPLAGPDYHISADVGRQVGGNLFHSFGEFNVHQGESATFTGPNTVTNVIGRVTGGNPSTIDGTIRSDIPEANLYLINPRGVMFGANASLDVEGSFHVSTADYLKLGDGGRFAATQPSNSVLTTAPPEAFGFLSANPAPISTQNSSLFVSAGKTLSVVGGDLHIQSSTLAAPSGQVNIASVASPGEVVANAPEQPASLQVDSFSRLGQIEVANKSSISASGQGGGSVVIRGGKLTLDNSLIGSNTFGAVDGKDIDIRLTGDLLNHSGEISTATMGDGHGGNIEMDVGRLELTGGGTIEARNRGAGTAGMVKITAADSVTLTDEAQITSSSLGSGRGGIVNITARNSFSASGQDSGLFSEARGQGAGGSIILETQQVQLTDGAVISAKSTGEGNAGNLSITARNTFSSQKSGLFSETQGRGEGGNIILETQQVQLTDGAVISAKSTGEGNAGNLTISAAGTFSDRGSGLFSEAQGRGAGGSIILEATQVQLSDGAVISAKSTGEGNAGNLAIAVNNSFRSENSAVTTEADHVGGGKIQLSAGSQVYLTDSQMTASVKSGKGNGGDITITPQFSTLSSVILNNSRVVANAQEGNGGNIRINSNVYLASSDSIVDASSQKGINGEIDVRSSVTNISGSFAPLPETFLNAAELLPIRCAARLKDGKASSFVLAGRAGLPLEPGGVLPSPLDRRDRMAASAEHGQRKVQGTPTTSNQQGKIAKKIEQREAWRKEGLSETTPDVACATWAWGTSQDSLPRSQ